MASSLSIYIWNRLFCEHTCKVLCWFFIRLFTFVPIPFWLDIVLYDSPATVPKVNLLIHDTRVPSHTVYTQSILDALPGTWQNPRCLSDEHIVTAWTCFPAKGCRAVFDSSRHNVLYIFHPFASQIVVLSTTLREASATFRRLCNFENFHRSRHLYLPISRIISPR